MRPKQVGDSCLRPFREWLSSPAADRCRSQRRCRLQHCLLDSLRELPCPHPDRLACHRFHRRRAPSTHGAHHCRSPRHGWPRRSRAPCCRRPGLPHDPRPNLDALAQEPGRSPQPWTAHARCRAGCYSRRSARARTAAAPGTAHSPSRPWVVSTEYTLHNRRATPTSGSHASAMSSDAKSHEKIDSDSPVKRSERRGFEPPQRQGTPRDGERDGSAPLHPTDAGVESAAAVSGWAVAAGCSCASHRVWRASNSGTGRPPAALRR